MGKDNNAKDQKDAKDPMFDPIVRGAQEWNRKQQEKQQRRGKR